jgi:hypothetical protein
MYRRLSRTAGLAALATTFFAALAAHAQVEETLVDSEQIIREREVSESEARFEEVDVIRVHGDLLHGYVVSLTPTGLEFSTSYGGGTISIGYADVQEIATRDPMRILYGARDEAMGRILGIDDGALLVGDVHPETALRIPVSEIRGGISEAAWNGSLMTRLRTRYRFWSANFDLGFDFEEGAVDKRKIRFGLAVERDRAPTRYQLRFDYAFDTQQQGGDPQTTTKDEFLARLQAEYTFFKKVFTFAGGGAERDVPRNINIRAYPLAGLGYDVVKTESGWLWQVLGGFGWVYEDFGLAFPSNDYAAAVIATELRAPLWGGSEARLGFFYMPGITTADENWLFRARFDLTVPIYDPLAFKLTITDTADNNPTPTVGNNKFTTLLGFSIVF